MKNIKIWMIILAYIISILVTISCGSNTNNTAYAVNDEVTIMNRLDYNFTLKYRILYDRYTRVMYLVTTEGGVTPMINSDGTPLLYNPDTYNNN